MIYECATVQLPTTSATGSITVQLELLVHKDFPLIQCIS